MKWAGQDRARFVSSFPRDAGTVQLDAFQTAAPCIFDLGCRQVGDQKHSTRFQLHALLTRLRGAIIVLGQKLRVSAGKLKQTPGWVPLRKSGCLIWGGHEAMGLVAVFAYSA
jgi:hypothetical protein